MIYADDVVFLVDSFRTPYKNSLDRHCGVCDMNVRGSEQDD